MSNAPDAAMQGARPDAAGKTDWVHGVVRKEVTERSVPQSDSVSFTCNNHNIVDLLATSTHS